MSGSVGSEVALLETQFFHSPAGSLWASYLGSWSLRVLICKVGLTAEPTSESAGSLEEMMGKS